MKGKYEKWRESDGYQQIQFLEQELENSQKKMREMERLLVATAQQLEEGCDQVLTLQKLNTELMMALRDATAKKRRWWDRMW